MRVLLLSSVSILACAIAGQAMAQQPVITDIPEPVGVASRAATGTVAPRPISVGQTVRGVIGAEDPKLSSDQSSYEVYRVQVPAGHRAVATLTSTAFQPVVSIGPSVDEPCEGCKSNSGETTRPAVASYAMTSGGALEIRVNTMNAGETGAFTLAVSAAPPPPLVTQPIVFGQTKTGALTATDAQVGDEEPKLTDAYALRLAANQSVQIDLSSSEFDAKLELLSPSGRSVSEDDDSGPGTSARIRFTPPNAGVYQIRATALSDNGMGAYTLRAGARPAVLPFPPPRPLVLGTPTAGALTQATPTYENDGEETTAVHYSFNAVAGNAYMITAAKGPSSDLDPRISVGKLVNGVFDSEASDDDGGEDTNSALRFRATRSGLHVVEVSPVGENRGAYEVKVVQSPPDRAPGNPIPVTLGTDYRGSLVDGGARDREDVLYNTYSIALTAGQNVTVQVNAAQENALDPKLIIGRGTPSAFEEIAQDDDSGANVNARLRFIAPTDGTYLLRATGLSSTSQGDYVLRVDTTVPPILPPEPTAIQAGQALSGSLAETDPSLNDTTYYDRYVLNGQVGDTFEISVSGDGFDAIVGARSSLRVDDDYVSDDDSGGGTNAKLTYTVSTAGPQTIRVTSVSEQSVGTYTISVVKK